MYVSKVYAFVFVSAFVWAALPCRSLLHHRFHHDLNIGDSFSDHARQSLQLQ